MPLLTQDELNDLGAAVEATVNKGGLHLSTPVTVTQSEDGMIHVWFMGECIASGVEWMAVVKAAAQRIAAILRAELDDQTPSDVPSPF